MEQEKITDYKLLLDTAVLAGEIMLKSGAEIFRVEDTMQRILLLAHFKYTETYVTSTGLFATLDDPKYDSMTVLRRIHVRGTNMYRLHAVNEISRNLCAGRITLKEAFHQLKHMPQSIYPSWLRYVSAIVSAMMFAVILQGGVADAIGATITALALVGAMYTCEKFSFNMFLEIVLQSGVIALTAMLCVYVSKGAMSFETVATGPIMPLLPGAALATAVRDTLQGDYLAGMSRVLEAVIVAFAIVIGMGLVMLLGGELL